MGLIRRAVCLVCSSPSATIMIKAGQLMNSEQALNNLFEVAEIQGQDAVKLLSEKDRKEVLDNFGVCNACTGIADKAADLKRQLAQVKTELAGKLAKGVADEADQTAGPKVKDVKVLEKQKKLQNKFLECLSNKGPKQVAPTCDQGSNGAEADDIYDTQEDSTSPDPSYESCNSSPESSEKNTVQTTRNLESQPASSKSSVTAKTLKRRPGRPPKSDASRPKPSKSAAAGPARSSKRVSNRRKKSFYQQSRFSDFVVNPSRKLKVVVDNPSLKIKKKRGRKPGTSMKPLATSNKQIETQVTGPSTITRTSSLTRVVKFNTTGPQQSTLLKKRTGARGRPRKVVQAAEVPTVLPIPVPAIDAEEDEDDDDCFTPDDDMLDMEDDEESYSESGSHAILKKVKPNVSDEVDYMSLLNKTDVVVEDANSAYVPPTDVDMWMAEEEMRTGPSINNDLFVVEYPCSHCTVVCSTAEMLRFHYEREHVKTLSFSYF